MQLPFGKKEAGSASAKADDSKRATRGRGSERKSGDAVSGKDARGEKGARGGKAKGSIKGEAHKGKRGRAVKEKPTEPSGIFGAPAAILRPRLVFILAMVCLCVVGLVMIYSSSSIEAYTDVDFGNDPHRFFRMQLIWLAVGIVGCCIASFSPTRFWTHPFTALFLWVVTVALLIGVLLVGSDLLGATRSINLGPFSLQPSEFAKISVVLLMVCVLERWNSGAITPWLATGEIAVVAVITLALIYRQPDLGTSIILIVGMGVSLIIAGVPRQIIFGIVGVCVAFVAMVCVAQPYHLDRIATMVNPWEDAQGDSYQTIQGFLAFGSGGLFGTGLGLSRQKYSYIPYAYNDFIYAVIGEELGLVGALVVLLLFAVLIVSGIMISKYACDNRSAVLACAFTSMVGFQACVNMACVVGVAPVTGKALPFISYGGSSLIATMIMCGFVLSVSRESRLEADVERRRDDLLVVEGGKSRRAAGNVAAAATVAGARGAHAAQPFGFRDLFGGVAGAVSGAAGAAGSRIGRNRSQGAYDAADYVRDAQADDAYADGYYDDDSAAYGRKGASSVRGARAYDDVRGRSSGRMAYGVYGGRSAGSSSAGSRGARGSAAGRYESSERDGRAERGGRGGSRSASTRSRVKAGDLDVELIDIAPRTGRPSRDRSASSGRGANADSRSCSSARHSGAAGRSGGSRDISGGAGRSGGSNRRGGYDSLGGSPRNGSSRRPR